MLDVPAMDLVDPDKIDKVYMSAGTSSFIGVSYSNPAKKLQRGRSNNTLTHQQRASYKQQEILYRAPFSPTFCK
jgi:hypothetical protein